MSLLAKTCGVPLLMACILSLDHGLQAKASSEATENHLMASNMMLNSFRKLTHITFQGPLPEGCTVLDFTHDFESSPAKLVDVIQCTDFCGPGKYVNLTLTSVCTTLDEEGCVNTVDCIVPGCNEDCDAEAGDCDCTDKFLLDADGNLAVDEGLCDELCAAEPGDVVTPAPTRAPTSSPVSVVVPTASPTGAPVEGLVPTDSPVAEDSPTLPGTDCFSSTALLAEAITTVDTAMHTTFKLCPNTVFLISDPALDEDYCSDENYMAPLFLRSNVTIQCGDNGSSSNNCTLQGGKTQVTSLPGTFGENTVNASVYGVTFKATTETGAFLANAGDVAFVDCVFRDHVNFGAVSMAWSPPPEAEGLTPEDLEPGSYWNQVLEVIENVNDFADQFQSRRSICQRKLSTQKIETSSSATTSTNSNTENRHLTHITFLGPLPEGCTVSDFTHDFESVPAILVDIIQCVDFCGPGKYINLTLTSVCTTLDEEGCVNTLDCIVPGCNEDCDAKAGDCDCTDKFLLDADGNLAVDEGLCDELCAAEPGDVVTPAPTRAPTSSPVSVVVPTPAPTKAPTSSPVSLVVPTASPTGAPAEGMVPTDSPVAEDSPTGAPVEDVVPTDSPAAIISPTGSPDSFPSADRRQKIAFRNCTFLSNQPLWSDNGPKAVMIAETAFNDLVIENCYFSNNDFGRTDGVGTGILIQTGSTIDIRGTCFVSNDFKGPGTVVVVDSDQDAILFEEGLNNFGTEDDELTCEFIALVTSLVESPFSCVDYDAEQCSLVSPVDPTVAPTAESPAIPSTPAPSTVAPTAPTPDIPTILPSTEAPVTQSPGVPSTLLPSTAAPSPQPASPTEAPSGSPVCTVCPAGTVMTLPDASVAIPAGIISDEVVFATCELVDMALASDPDLAEFCDLIQQNFAEQCGCMPISDGSEGEDTPTPASPTTVAPSGTALCSICPSGTEMSMPDASIAIPAGIISDEVFFATCGLVENALASNPDLAEFCDLIQQNYAEPCGCIPISNGGDGEASPTPVSPTTETPPGSPFCTVCPDGTEMTLPDASVAIPAGLISDGVLFATCELMDRAIAFNPDLAEFCDLIQQNYAEPCGCTPISDGSDGEGSPPTNEEDSSLESNRGGLFIHILITGSITLAFLLC